MAVDEYKLSSIAKLNVNQMSFGEATLKLSTLVALSESYLILGSKVVRVDGFNQRSLYLKKKSTTTKAGLKNP